MADEAAFSAAPSFSATLVWRAQLWGPQTTVGPDHLGRHEQEDYRADRRRTSAQLPQEGKEAVDADYIEKIGLASSLATEEIIRILYYDCALFNGETKLPVSRTVQTFSETTPYLHELARKDLFAVRRGVLKFRGYVIRKGHQPSSPPVDSDFTPKFQQKGVDMRIGLDMATIAANRSVDLIALMTNDTDCVPAMKLVRRSGIQVALLCIPGCRPAPELLAHSDFMRSIPWP